MISDSEGHMKMVTWHADFILKQRTSLWFIMVYFSCAFSCIFISFLRVWLKYNSAVILHSCRHVLKMLLLKFLLFSQSFNTSVTYSTQSNVVYLQYTKCFLLYTIFNKLYMVSCGLWNQYTKISCLIILMLLWFSWWVVKTWNTSGKLTCFKQRLFKQHDIYMILKNKIK